MVKGAVTRELEPDIETKWWSLQSAETGCFLPGVLVRYRVLSDADKTAAMLM